MVEMRTTKLKRLQKFCAGNVPVILDTFLYRSLKLTYPTDVGAIILDGRMTTEMGTRSLGQFVGVLSAADFRPVCV